MSRDGASRETSGRESVHPDVLQVITLDDIAVGIAKLVELVEAQTPLGEAPYIALTATTDLQEVPLQPSWVTAQVINDGTDTLEVHLNHTHRAPRELRAGEDVEFRFSTPVIERLFLRAQAGTLAIRIQGLY